MESPVTETKDERTFRVGSLTRVMRRPEFGALVAAIVIFVMFVFADQSGEFFTLGGLARWTEVASYTGIMAIAVGVLMIGGEFDLSAGVMVGSTGLFLGLLITKLHLDTWLAVFMTLIFAALIGAMNGYIVVQTKLPSFIVTLATFFVLRGFNLGFVQLWTGTVRIDGVDQGKHYESARKIFASTLFAPYGFSITVFWWVALTIVASWVLTRTTAGNWITAVGGDANAARNTGVPVKRTKILLFVLTSTTAGLVGIMSGLRFTSIQASQGVGEEFTYIIAAVVGGCLLTGGFGSALGASIGASIIGIAFIGISFAGWNTDWNYAFLGAILFAAVSVNTLIRRRAEGTRK
jgi:simple sugar transport system permease protein